MATIEAELKTLMVASLAGDAPAHRALLARLSGHLRAYFKGKLARIGRSVAEVEDLVQEALLAIHTRRHTYDPTEPLTPWVYAIARYKLIDHLRAARASIVDLPIEDAGEIVAQDDHAGAESAYGPRAELRNVRNLFFHHVNGSLAKGEHRSLAPLGRATAPGICTQNFRNSNRKPTARFRRSPYCS